MTAIDNYIDVAIVGTYLQAVHGYMAIKRQPNRPMSLTFTFKVKLKKGTQYLQLFYNGRTSLKTSFGMKILNADEGH